MIYKFKVLSEEDPKFFMDIEIMSDQTFYDLHDFIQEELEYDSSLLATFFIANHNWQQKQEIALIEANGKDGEKIIAMDKAVLSTFMKDAHQKLIYLFDFINNRTFFIELMETKQETSNKYYPICIDFGGEIPPQFGKKITQKSSLFEDDDDDINVFSSKKVAPIIDDELEEDFASESFEKDIQFEFEDDSMLAGEAEEEDDEVDKDMVQEEDDGDPDED
jgi:hypothetical protein